MAKFPPFFCSVMISIRAISCCCIILLSLSWTGFALAAEKLLPSSNVVVFEVSMNKETMAGLKRLPWEFDHSSFDIWTDLNATNCWFEINRRPFENKRLEKMVSGKLDIINGEIIFGAHKWRTGGMASPDYLKHESNLKVLRNGRPVGKMPYFHLFINKGEVALPPVFVELTRNREGGNSGSASGIFSFYVDDWQEALFEIRNC